MTTAEDGTIKPPRRVLVCMRDEAMSTLLLDTLEALASDAFAADAVPWDVAPCELLAAVLQRGADVLLFELWREETQVFRLLDALRADQATARVPVVALATKAEDAERARASYNVREALIVPVDLDDLLESIHRALASPPLHATLPPVAAPPTTLAAAEHLLATRSREVLFGWAQRLRQQQPWAARDDLSLANLLDTMPLVVEALHVALHTHDPRRYFPEHHDALVRLQAHARTRRAQDIGLVDVVREYTVLRDEVWRLFRRQLPAQVPSSDVLTLAEVINLTLDHVLEATIAAYLAAASASGGATGATARLDAASSGGSAGATNTGRLALPA